MKNTYIIGDIHGRYDKLKSCLDSVNFNFEKDKLIQLGDIVDRGYEVYECVELLMKIKNLISIRGNHDHEWLHGLMTGQQSSLWSQGARETSQSYTRQGINPEIHYNFFKNQIPYYIDENNNLFIHGGFNRHKELDDQEELLFYWDRDLFLSALSYEAMKDKTYQFKMKQSFNEIFVGHTPTIYWGNTTPMKAANIWNLDTGSGKGGLLTIMNLQTKEFKQF